MHSNKKKINKIKLAMLIVIFYFLRHLSRFCQVALVSKFKQSYVNLSKSCMSKMLFALSMEERVKAVD